MATEPIRVLVTVQIDWALVECSDCGPVGVTSLSPREAATEHLATHQCHKIEETQ